MKIIVRLSLAFSVVLLLSQCVLDSGPQKKTQDNTPAGTGVQAIDMLTAQIKETPDNPELYFQRAQSYMENKAYSYAVADMQKAISLDSINPFYYHLLSDAQMDNFQSREALMTMMRVGSMYPKRTATQLKLAENQVILQQYDGALSTINKILKYDPQNAEAYFMLGLTLYEQEEIKRAKNALLTAVENDPEILDAWFMLGNIAEQEKNTKEAKTYFENALRAKPNSIQAMHTLAFFLQNNGDMPRAQSLYKKIHVQDKDYFQANLNSGILYVEVDSLDKAYEQFNIIVDRHPSNHMGYYYRGVVNELKGDLEAAMADYQTSVNMKGDFEKAVTAAAAMKKALAEKK